MGLIERFLSLMFGDGRNALSQTAEVFRENAERQAQREAVLRSAALGQFQDEFSKPPYTRFDRFIDGLNRLPRPMLAFGTIGLFVSAMIEPVWFASRMQGIAIVPQPLWWLLGAIVSFYFGARHQVKGQAFQREIAQTLARVPDVMRDLADLQALKVGTGHMLSAEQLASGEEASVQDKNPALNDWDQEQGSAGR